MLLLLAGWLGSLAPLLDLANIVRTPVAVGCAALAVILIVFARSLRARLVFVGCIFLGLASLWPSGEINRDCAGTPVLRLAWINAQKARRPGLILEWLENEQPDVVGFAELGSRSVVLREQLAARYPFRQSCLDNDRCSTMLYSRIRPTASSALARGDPQNRRSLSAAHMRFDTAEVGQRLDVFTVHLSRPLPLGRQRAELLQLGSALDEPGEAIIIGDLNMPPRMRALRDFAAANGLSIWSTDRPTWPLSWAGRPVPAVLQIDHLLTGREWSVAKIETSPDLGSDHRGFVAELCRAS